MKCETARTRLPEPSASRHVASCESCAAWLARVERARGLASASFPPFPPGLATRVLSTSSARAVSAPEQRSGAATQRRRPRFVRAGAVGAAVLVVAAAATVWVVRSSERPAEALAAAAAATKNAESARFSFQGNFSVRLRLSPGVLEGVTREAEDALRSAGRAIAPPGFPRELRKALEQQLELRREWLFELMKPIESAIPAISPEVRLRVDGEGGFAARDRVRIHADIEVHEPATAEGAFEFVRVGSDTFLKLETTGWRAAAGVPTRVLRPVASGLSRLTDWVAHDVESARLLGRETLAGIETARYRVDLPARGRGVRNVADVWVGLDDDLVHRVLVTHTVNRPFTEISGTVDVRLFDHGTSVEVEIPRGAILRGEPRFSPEVGLHLEVIDLWLGAGLPGPRE